MAENCANETPVMERVGDEAIEIEGSENGDLREKERDTRSNRKRRK